MTSAGSGTIPSDFLSRIRAALDAPANSPPPPDSPPISDPLIRLVGHDDDIKSRFVSSARAAGMQVHETTPAGALASLRALLFQLRIDKVTLALLANSPALDWESAIRLAGCRIVPWKGTGIRDSHFSVAAGITDCLAAVAETGSLILASGQSAGRNAWLVPPLHIALLRTSQILPDLIDAMPLLARPESSRRLPAAVVFVTGPSKTADIEGILITGVHGPGAVHILLIDDQPPHSSSPAHSPSSTETPPC